MAHVPAGSRPARETMERITVTLPAELMAGIQAFETNRSRFIAEAVAREVARRRHEQLLRSIAEPHPEARELAELGFDEWVGSADEGLVDPAAGQPVRWVEGRGWVEEKK